MSAHEISVMGSVLHEMILSQVTFARNCFSISARLVLDTPEIIDLCVIKCVQSAKIWCVRKLNFFLSMNDAVELIFHS